MAVKVRRSGADRPQDFLQGGGEVVVLLAVGRALFGRHGGHQGTHAGLRVGAVLFQKVQAQLLPEGSGIQQRAVQIKNRTLQSHGIIPRFPKPEKLPVAIIVSL